MMDAHAGRPAVGAQHAVHGALVAVERGAPGLAFPLMVAMICHPEPTAKTSNRMAMPEAHSRG